MKLDKSGLQKSWGLVAVCLFSACNNAEDTPGDLHCEISAAPNTNCSEHPVLQRGTLEIDKNGRFEFVGFYEACFDKRTLEAEGQYRYQSFPGGMNIELLAKKLSDSKSDNGNFPRTIGTVNLQLEKITGTYTDLWAIMSTRATQSEDREQRLSVACQR